MNDDVLLRFLNKGLIDVGGDDDKLGHLRQTAADLTGILEERPAKASPFALVAFDPDVPTTDPTIAEAGEALRKRWETYVNTFAKTPVAVFRAILLDAVTKACEKNDTVAAAFVASARNVLPFMEVGEEREIWIDIVGDIERKVEERAEREWATPASISVPEVKFEAASVDIRIASKKTSASNLKSKFEEAAGPHSNNPADGTQRNTEGNQYMPQSNPYEWVHEFGRLMAEAVGGAINRAIGGLSVEGADLPGLTQEMTRVMSEQVSTTLQAVSSATTGIQRRTNLLWWKEALFSPSVRKSYRELSTFDAAMLMAFDMHRHIPTFSPPSVSAFLKETVIALPTMDQDERVAIRELVEKARNSSILEELRTEAGKLVVAPVGRSSVLGLIGHWEALPQIEDGTFRDLVGVKPDTPLTLPDWSVWIFREFQAARAIAEASAPKHRTSGKRK